MLQYRSVKRVYGRWCEDRGLAPWPISPQQLLQFIKHLKGRNLSPATLAAYIAALSTISRYHGYTRDQDARAARAFSTVTFATAVRWFPTIPINRVPAQ